MNEKIKELNGGNLDIDLISQEKVPWKQAACPWNTAEGVMTHKCAEKCVSICKYFCGLKYMDTVLCGYPHELGGMTRDEITGTLTRPKKKLL